MKNKTLINSLAKSMLYPQYIQLVANLVENNSTTGNEKTADRVQYTQLNARRMKRWDRTLKITEADINKIKTIQTDVTWLVITESWCGDAAHILPVINRIASLNNKIQLHIVLRDENPELIQQFLTNGAQAIPKLIAINEQTKKVLYTFGPRPTAATQMVENYKAKHGMLTPEFKEDLQKWYNKNKGQAVINDLIQLLENNIT